jgi:hypothetical protein
VDYTRDTRYRALVDTPTTTAHDRDTVAVRSASGELARVTPAIEAGVANHVWSVEEIVALKNGKSRMTAETGRDEFGVRYDSLRSARSIVPAPFRNGVQHGR